MQALNAGEAADEVWYWLAMAADTTDERHIYLNKLLETNPLHEEALMLLSQTANKNSDTSKVSKYNPPSSKPATYEYLVVPFQGKLPAGGSVAEVSTQLQSIINTHSAQGWEFFVINDVNIEVSPGCIGALLGAHISYVTYDQVIFRRLTGR